MLGALEMGFAGMNDSTSHLDDLTVCLNGMPRRRFLTIVGSGVPAAALTVATAGTVAAQTAVGSSATVGGSLGVDSGGALANYVIDPPSGKAITLLMNYSPFDSESAHRVGFNVYQNGVKLFGSTGKATGLHDPANLTTISTTLTPSASAGPVQVQVFNYSQLPIDFSLVATGATLTPQ